MTHTLAQPRFAPVYNPAGTGGYDIVDRTTGAGPDGAWHWFSSLHFAEKACVALNAGKPCPSMADMCEAPAMLPQQVQQQQACASMKSPGQLAYEADCAAQPAYHDGQPRKAWSQLCYATRDTWHRNPTPKPRAAAMVPMPVQQQQAQDARHAQGILSPGCIPEPVRPVPLNEGRKHSTKADGTPRKGWFDARCTNAGHAPYLTQGAVYRLRPGRNGWLETEGGDLMAAFRFEPIEAIPTA